LYEEGQRGIHNHADDENANMKTVYYQHGDHPTTDVAYDVEGERIFWKSFATQYRKQVAKRDQLGTI
jgi:hypothetical protein